MLSVFKEKRDNQHHTSKKKGEIKPISEKSAYRRYVAENVCKDQHKDKKNQYQ